MKLFKCCFAALFVVVTIAYFLVTGADRANSAGSAPVITCPPEVLEVSVNADPAALMAGLTASDAEDGDLTGQIMLSGISKLVDGNTAKVTFRVFDSDDQMASCVRTIRYTDYRSPQFSLNEPLTYASTYNIALIDRLHASDCIDGDMTNQIRVSYLEDTDNLQLYMVRVQVTNSMGDTSQLTLPVYLEERVIGRPVIRLSSYLLYLDKDAAFEPMTMLQGVETADGAAVNAAVHVSGTVNTAVPGTYHLSYSCIYNNLPTTTYLTVVVE